MGARQGAWFFRGILLLMILILMSPHNFISRFIGRWISDERKMTIVFCLAGIIVLWEIFFFYDN